MRDWSVRSLMLAVLAWLAPCLAGAQPLSAPVPVRDPVRVEVVRQPVANDRAANQNPRDQTIAPLPAGQAPPLNSLAGLSVDYRIGPNDLIDVEVYGVPDLKRTVRVNSSGVVSLALVGNIRLASLTAQEAEAAIAQLYSGKYLQDPQVSVFVREFTTQRITIEGAVVRPGIYPLTGQITVLQALALAGGGAQYANLDEIMLFRQSKSGRQTQTFNLEKIRRGENPDPTVEPEDVIVVKRNAARTALRDSLFRDILDSINPFSGFARP